jgi:hypothetical protein
MTLDDLRDGIPDETLGRELKARLSQFPKQIE